MAAEAPGIRCPSVEVKVDDVSDTGALRGLGKKEMGQKVSISTVGGSSICQDRRGMNSGAVRLVISCPLEHIPN